MVNVDTHPDFIQLALCYVSFSRASLDAQIDINSAASLALPTMSPKPPRLISRSSRAPGRRKRKLLFTQGQKRCIA
jgi:hypothetical protein